MKVKIDSNKLALLRANLQAEKEESAGLRLFIKSQNTRIKELETDLKTALEYISLKEGCPYDEKFIMQNQGCEKCNEDQNLSICWKDFFKFKQRTITSSM